ncbi:hypothetical protein HK101_004204 [Irineochytrium annulatum]|nr:hypothetical protein HK101_004204 [Irineochytrium annulatum]
MDPLEDIDIIAGELKSKYDLDTALVCFAPLKSDEEIQKHISKRAADYLQETVQDADIIGVTWGTTMHAVARQLRPKQVKGVEVVQLKGGVSHSHVNTYLPLPVIFDNIEVKNMVEADRHIGRIVELGRQANIALFTVAKMIDHTLLRADATQSEMAKLTEEAKQYQFASGTGVDICTVIGFPLGASTTETKAFETKDAIAKGATEVDMVINISALKDGKDDYVEQDIRAVVEAAAGKALVKVIIETCLLTDDEKVEQRQKISL